MIMDDQNNINTNNYSNICVIFHDYPKQKNRKKQQIKILNHTMECKKSSLHEPKSLVPNPMKVSSHSSGHQIRLGFNNSYSNNTNNNTGYRGSNRNKGKVGEMYQLRKPRKCNKQVMNGESRSGLYGYLLEKSMQMLSDKSSSNNTNSSYVNPYLNMINHSNSMSTNPCINSTQLPKSFKKILKPNKRQTQSTQSNIPEHLTSTCRTITFSCQTNSNKKISPSSHTNSNINANTQYNYNNSNKNVRPNVGINSFSYQVCSKDGRGDFLYRGNSRMTAYCMGVVDGVQDKAFWVSRKEVVDRQVTSPKAEKINNIQKYHKPSNHLLHKQTPENHQKPSSQQSSCSQHKPYQFTNLRQTFPTALPQGKQQKQPSKQYSIQQRFMVQKDIKYLQGEQKGTLELDLREKQRQKCRFGDRQQSRKKQKEGQQQKIKQKDLKEMKNIGDNSFQINSNPKKQKHTNKQKKIPQNNHTIKTTSTPKHINNSHKHQTISFIQPLKNLSRVVQCKQKPSDSCQPINEEPNQPVRPWTGFQNHKLKRIIQMRHYKRPHRGKKQHINKNTLLNSYEQKQRQKQNSQKNQIHNINSCQIVANLIKCETNKPRQGFIRGQGLGQLQINGWDVQVLSISPMFTRKCG